MMPYKEWLAEVARLLGVPVESVERGFYQVSLLYDSNASPAEAADFIELNA